MELVCDIRFRDGTQRATVASARTITEFERLYKVSLFDLVGPGRRMEWHYWLAYDALGREGVVRPIFTEWLDTVASVKVEPAREVDVAGPLSGPSVGP